MNKNVFCLFLCLFFTHTAVHRDTIFTRRHFVFVYIQRVYNLHLQYGGDLLRQLIAENDRALSGRDIRYLVPFRPEPEPEPDRKKRPDILLTGTGTGYPVHP